MGGKTARLFAVMALLAQGCGSGKSGGAAGVSDGGVGAGALPDGFFSVTLPEAGADARADGAGMAAVVPTMLHGKVVLPPGFPTPMGQLKVRAALGSTAPDASGNFAVMGAGKGRQGALVTDQNGRLVLFGWVRPDDPASTLSTTNTAAGLLFLCGGAAFLPVGHWNRAIDLLQADPNTQKLAQFLDARLAANPNFLTLATPADTMALAQAATEALTGIAPSIAALRQKLVLVNPGTSKSGVTVLIGDKEGNANSDINQITFMNEYRRRGYAFIDRKAPQGDSYVQEAAFELPPTNGLNGAIGSVGDVINGNGAWTPVYYGPVGLGAVVNEEEVISYRVRVVGLGSPADLELTQAQLDQWKFIMIKSALVDAFLPALFSLVEFDFLTDFLQSQFMAEFIVQMVSQAYSGGLITIGKYLEQGDLFGAITELGNVLYGNDAFRTWMLDQFRNGIVENYGPGAAADFVEDAGMAMLNAFKIVDKITGAVNLYNVVQDARKSNSADEWEVKVRAPKILLTPAKAKLACGEKAAFDVTVKNGGQKLTGDLVYSFENTGQFGHLTTDANATYNDKFEATKPRVYYTVNTDGMKMGTDTVTVKVNLIQTQDKGPSTKTLLGEAQAQVAVQATCTSSGGYTGSDAYTSGCTRMLSAPSTVHPGEVVTVSVAAGSGGVCGQASVWMSFAVSASLDGGPEVTRAIGGGGGIYDFCYTGGPQPFVPGGAGVDLPDDQAHTIKFKIDPNMKCPVCVKEVLDGTPCSSNPGNRQNINGPAVVNSGNGGTHGWSTVRFFNVVVP